MTFTRLRLTSRTTTLVGVVALVAAPLLTTAPATATPVAPQAPLTPSGTQMIAGHPTWRMSAPSIDPTLPIAARRAHASSATCVNNVCPAPGIPPPYRGGLLITQPRVYILVFSDTPHGDQPVDRIPVRSDLDRHPERRQLHWGRAQLLVLVVVG